MDIHADFTAAAGQRLQAAGRRQCPPDHRRSRRRVAARRPVRCARRDRRGGEIPARWLTWLKVGGRALIVRGQSPVQEVVLLTHEGAGRYREEVLFETDLPYLTHAEPAQRFVF